MNQPKRPVGRPKLPTTKDTKRINAKVTPEQHATWLQVGASKWLKQVLDDLKEKKQ